MSANGVVFGGRSSPALTLSVVLTGVFAVAMSISGAGVAVPGIAAELDASGAALQWVISAYNLALSAFTLVCGSLSDLFGRRRMFVLTTVLFAGGSLVCVLAQDIALLNAARAVAGIGAGGVMASGGAILAVTFDGAARTRAFAAMGTMGGAGVVAGPFVAGWLVAGLGWRESFLSYVVVGALILLGTLFVAESRSSERSKVDRPGVATFVLGLGLLMFGLIQAPQGGWGGAAGLVAGTVLLVVFVLVERRSEHPVLALALVGNPRFMGWCLGTVFTSVGFVGVLVFLPTYLQGVAGTSAEAAGTAMLMLTVPILAVPMAAGWLVNRGVPARWLMTSSLALVAAGNAWLTVLHPGMGLGELLGPLLAIGVALGVSFGITDAQAMNQVDPARLGMAAGFLNTIRNGGEALVIAVFGTALIALVQARVGSAELANRVAAGDLSGPDRTWLAEQFTDSWRVVLWTVAGICAAAAVVVHVLLVPRGRAAAAEPAKEAVPGYSGRSA
jgi:MFS family permease